MVVVRAVLQDPRQRDACHFGRAVPSGWRGDEQAAPGAQPGQVLTFTQGERVRVIRIVALGTRRGPASEAVELYEDLSPEMPKRRAERAAETSFESGRKVRPTDKARSSRDAEFEDELR